MDDDFDFLAEDELFVFVLELLFSLSCCFLRANNDGLRVLPTPLLFVLLTKPSDIIDEEVGVKAEEILYGLCLLQLHNIVRPAAAAARLRVLIVVGLITILFYIAMGMYYWQEIA